MTEEVTFEEKPKPAAKKNGKQIKNLRTGAVKELTSDQTKDKLLMQRIENGIRTGQLKEV